MSNELGFKTLDDFDWKGKTVLLRVDLNCPVEKGVVQDSPRVAAHAKTVRELALKGARVVVLAHQGRPGDEDFLSLEQHAVLLEKHCRKKVKFVPDVTGPEVEKRVRKMVDGKIVLLDNLRFSAEEMLEKTPEEHAKSTLVRKLAPLAQAFVNDAYSVSHRSHCSVVGFTPVLPSFAGPVLEKEYLAAKRLSTELQRPAYYVLGGVKPEDVIPLLEHGLKGADKVFVGGALAMLCLAAAGQATPAINTRIADKKWDRHVETVKQLMAEAGGKIVVPVDYAVEDKGTRVEFDAGALPSDKLFEDLGSKTIELWSKELKQARTILFKGVLGKVEKPEFAFGTQRVLKAGVKSGAFTVLSGGSYLAEAAKTNLLKKIGHVSLAGGAFITQLRGGTLPGVEALRAAARS